MRILLFGKDGQLGQELQRSLAQVGELHALGRQDADFNQPQELTAIIEQTQSDVIVNAAAYTNVDQAEKEPESARRINAQAPAVLAEAAERAGAALIHYSTDFVFDGEKGSPYQESDTPNPINEYGRSKLAGEQAVQAAAGAYLVLRTSWVYSLHKDCFVTKVLRWARNNEVLRVVDDQIGSPTWCRFLADSTAKLLLQAEEAPYDYFRARSGVYHLSGRGAVSRYQWALEILGRDPNKHEQVAQEVIPVKSQEFDTLACRPAYSVLDCSRFQSTFGIIPPDWLAMLDQAMQES